MSRIIRIGNLGAGVQSTTLYLLEKEGKIEPCEAWIFADTQEEPKAVYDHLAWLEAQGGTRIIRTGRKVSLGDNLSRGMYARGQRFVSVPAYTSDTDHIERQGEPAAGCNYGQVRRQCTKEYKIEMIEKAIRQEILGLKPRQRFPQDISVVQLFGLSDDEPRRIRRVKENFQTHPWARPAFPLAERGWTRAMCQRFLGKRVPHEVPRSACTFCPYRSAIEWEHLQRTDPEGWQRAVQIDKALRMPGNVVNRKMEQKMYLHRSCLPLEVIDFARLAELERRKKKEPDLFDANGGACVDGMCGV